MRRLSLLSIPAFAAAVVLIISASSHAVSPAPSLRLIAPVGRVDAFRFPDDPQLYIPPAVYVAATNGAFELQAVGHGSSIEVWRVKRDASGVHRIGKLNLLGSGSFFEGLPRFFHAVLLDSSGAPVLQTDMPFCPTGSYDVSRVDASGPDQPTYPYFCGTNLSHAMVWGIDRGWASSPFLALKAAAIPDGRYTLKLTVNPSYASQLAIPAGNASVTLGLTVTTQAPPGFAARAAQARRLQSQTPSGERPRAVSAAEQGGNQGITADTAGGLPDLAALPAHDLSIESAERRDYLGFGATIWNAGPGPLVVEGFRHGSQPYMDAFQFIYENGKPTRSKAIGLFHFDTRPGHDHWHMEDIAQYDLLDATGKRIVLSEKQSFCLAPTDPVDLLKPGADWQPDRVGLASACAGDTSIWLRESLPAGWGDTYFQTVAGQSFDITGLPNGRYEIRVTTDPFHRILEPSYANNSSVLAITLGGEPGARTVTIG